MNNTALVSFAAADVANENTSMLTLKREAVQALLVAAHSLVTTEPERAQATIQEAWHALEEQKSLEELLRRTNEALASVIRNLMVQRDDLVAQLNASEHGVDWLSVRTYDEIEQAAFDRGYEQGHAEGRERGVVATRKMMMMDQQDTIATLNAEIARLNAELEGIRQ
jgi:flagellar biosynthesis/type III secretory pathway protein FliH